MVKYIGFILFQIQCKKIMSDSNKIRNLTKLGTVLGLTDGDDSGQFQNYKVSFLGKTSSCDVVWAYGISGRLPEGSTIYMTNQLGSEDNKAGVGSFSQERFKDLKSGELKVGNFLLESSVKFDANGDIIVTNPGNHIVKIAKNNTVTITANSTTSILGNDTITIAGNSTTSVTGISSLTAVGTVDITSSVALNIIAPLTNITSTTTTINGDLFVNGKINSTGDITSLGTITGSVVTALTSLLAAGLQLVAHVHNLVVTGTDNSGPNQ